MLSLSALPLSASASLEPTETGQAPALLVGVADDHSKCLARPDGSLAKYRDLDFEAVRVTIRWRPGQRLLGAIRVGSTVRPKPLPGEGPTTLWYLEVGFQTTVPRAKRRFYRGGAVDTRPGAPTPWRLAPAHCQPAVGAFFNFLLLDEDRLDGWQSGLLWRDGTHKPSYESVKETVQLVRSDAVDCTSVPGAGGLLLPTRPKEPAVLPPA